MLVIMVGACNRSVNEQSQKREVESARQATLSVLGKDADVSYITEDLLNEIARAKPTEVNVAPTGWQENGNTITKGTDGKWYWRSECSLTEWRVWGGNIRTERIVNCTSGILRYKISNG
jgi:hypothetical protein